MGINLKLIVRSRLQFVMSPAQGRGGDRSPSLLSPLILSAY